MVVPEISFGPFYSLQNFHCRFDKIKYYKGVFEIVTRVHIGIASYCANITAPILCFQMSYAQKRKRNFHCRVFLLCFFTKNMAPRYAVKVLICKEGYAGHPDLRMAIQPPPACPVPLYNCPKNAQHSDTDLSRARSVV